MDTINENLFIKKSKKKIETEKILNKNLEFSFDNKCAVTHITTDEMQSINIGENELDGIASLPISIENVDIGITMREKQSGEYKISVRTSNKINANEFCENFGGGGHSCNCASGVVTCHGHNLDCAKAGLAGQIFCEGTHNMSGHHNLLVLIPHLDLENGVFRPERIDINFIIEVVFRQAVARLPDRMQGCIRLHQEP